MDRDCHRGHRGCWVCCVLQNFENRNPKTAFDNDGAYRTGACANPSTCTNPTNCTKTLIETSGFQHSVSEAFFSPAAGIALAFVERDPDHSAALFDWTLALNPNLEWAWLFTINSSRSLSGSPRLVGAFVRLKGFCSDRAYVLSKDIRQFVVSIARGH